MEARIVEPYQNEPMRVDYEHMFNNNDDDDESGDEVIINEEDNRERVGNTTW